MTHGDAWGWHGDTRLHKDGKTTHGNTGGGQLRKKWTQAGGIGSQEGWKGTRGCFLGTKVHKCTEIHSLRLKKYTNA